MNSDLDALKKIRRDLHTIPELAGEEKETRAYIERFINRNTLNIDIVHNSPLGLIARSFKDNGSPVIAFRAELDGLPIKDTKSVSYASIHNGKSHACGHDVHMAILLQLIKFVDSTEFPLNCIFVFQSGEEVFAGAKDLAVVLKEFNIDFMYSLHVAPNLPARYFSFSSDLMLASNLTAELEIGLNQGHSAEKNDFLKFFSYIENLQRSYNSQNQIFKVTHVETNGYYNITPSKLKLYCNFRGTKLEDTVNDYEMLLKNISECNLIKGVNSSEIISKYPPLKNNDELNNLTKTVIAKAFGKQFILKCPFLLSSDDFSYYDLILDNVKTCYFFIGSYLDSKIEVHKENFDVDENCLFYGYNAYVTILKSLCNNLVY